MKKAALPAMRFNSYMAERIMYMENFAESVNLDFKYDGEDEFVLKDINISFKQGEMTAVLGHNGAENLPLQSILMLFCCPAAVRFTLTVLIQRTKTEFTIYVSV